MKTIEQVVDYVNFIKQGYVDDPSDTDYQDGYQEAILDLDEWLVSE